MRSRKGLSGTGQLGIGRAEIPVGSNSSHSGSLESIVYDRGRRGGVGGKCPDPQSRTSGRELLLHRPAVWKMANLPTDGKYGKEFRGKLNTPQWDGRSGTGGGC